MANNPCVHYYVMVKDKEPIKLSYMVNWRPRTTSTKAKIKTTRQELVSRLFKCKKCGQEQWFPVQQQMVEETFKTRAVFSNDDK